MPSLIRSSSLTGYRELVSELGGAPAALLRGAGIPAAAVDDGDTMIDFAAAIRLLQATAEALPCPDFGLRLSQRQGLHILGPLALIVRNAASVAEGLAAVGRHMHYYSPALRITIDSDGASESASRRLTLSIEAPGAAHRRQSTELSLAFIRDALQLLAGAQAKPKRVLCRHAPGLPAQRYRDWFGCPVLFGQEANAVVVDAAMLARPIDLSNPELKLMAEAYVEGLIAQRPADVAGQAGALVERLLHTQHCTLKHVASHLCMHERTLQRRLQEAGQGFDQMVDRIRRERAGEYLAQPRMPMTQIAALLGFAEQSSFNKACQRWFGATPTAARRGLQS